MLFVDLALACRLEVACAWRGIKYTQAKGKLQPEIKVAVASIAGGHVIYAGTNSPVNGAKGLGMHGPVTSTDLDCVEQFYSRRGTVPRVDVCPLADSSLLDLLRRVGYRLERFYSVLVCTVPDNTIAAPLPSGVRVSKVSPEERDLWLHTVAQGFAGEEVPPQETLDMLAPNFHSATATCFLAWVDGQPAGGGAMVTHSGVAELCSASTRPPFRKRGVQTALLHTRLLAAQEAGCDLAMVVTSQGAASQRNVERIGFRLAYTKAVVIKE